jgi:hypothetical protein
VVPPMDRLVVLHSLSFKHHPVVYEYSSHLHLHLHLHLQLQQDRHSNSSKSHLPLLVPNIETIEVSFVKPATTKTNMTKHQSQTMRTIVIHEEDAASLLHEHGIMKIRTVDESLHNRYGTPTTTDDDYADEKANENEKDLGKEKKTTIRFHKVIIREYCRTVGDNPSCSSGPPMRYVSCAYDVVWRLDAVLAFRVFAHTIFKCVLATTSFFFSKQHRLGVQHSR